MITAIENGEDGLTVRNKLNLALGIFDEAAVGAIPYALSATTMGMDATNLFWDVATKRLGIGGAPLATRLSVFGGGGAISIWKCTVASDARIEFYRVADRQGLIGWDLGTFTIAGETSLLLSTGGQTAINIDASQRLGINAAPLTQTRLYLFTSNSVTSGAYEGLLCYHTAINTSSSSGTFTAGRFVSEKASGAAGITGRLVGIESYALNSTSQTVAGATSIYSWIYQGSTGVFTDAKCIDAGGAYLPSGGTIGTLTGVHIRAQKITGVTTGYGVYQAGTSDLNYFAGNFGIGTTVPTTAFHLVKVMTGTTGAEVSSQILVVNAPTGGTTADYYGLSIENQSSGSQNYTSSGPGICGLSVSPVHNGTGTLLNITGIQSIVRKTSTGAITNARCYIAGGQAENATGTLTNLIGYLALTPIATGAITTAYGVFVQAQKITGVTTGYAFYQDGTTDLNYFGGLTTFRNTVLEAVTLTYAATTDLDFNNKGLQTVALTGNITFTTSNRGIGKSVIVIIVSDGSTRTFSFPAWRFQGAGAPANIAAGKTATLTLTGVFGTADTDIVAAYSVQP